MRHSKSVMPSISLNIIFGKDIDSFLFGEFNESAILTLRIKESSLFVPNILVEFGSVEEILMQICKIHQFSNLTDPEIIETEFQCLTH